MEHGRTTRAAAAALLLLALPACGMGLRHYYADDAAADGIDDNGGTDAAADEAGPVDDPQEEDAPPEPPPPSCGDGAADPGEECDDGNALGGDGCEADCRFTCHDPAECGDGNDCTIDACRAAGGGRLCTSDLAPAGHPCDDDNGCTTGDGCSGDGRCMGAPVACTDGSECTIDECDPATGGCVFTPLPLWFEDKDRDGRGNHNAWRCAAACPDGYVAGDDDCCDLNPAVYPGQPEFFEAPYTCGPYGTPSFDYDCNGVEERRWPGGGSCTTACAVVEGWSDDTDPPACGRRGNLVLRCDSAGTYCYPIVSYYAPQKCR